MTKTRKRQFDPHWKIAALLLGMTACAVEVDDSPAANDAARKELASQTAAITNASPIRVLLIGNSQLGYSGSAVAPALQDFSNRANLIQGSPAAPMTVTLSQGGLTRCIDYETNHLQDAIVNNAFDVVILQPPYPEATPNQQALDCWDRFRLKAQNAGAEFGMMSTNTPEDARGDGTFNYGQQSDVAMDTAIHNYTGPKGLLFIPANRLLRMFLGTNPGTAALDTWYEPDHAHPNSRGRYAYVVMLYEFISWRTPINGPWQLPAMNSDVPPSQSDAGTLQLYSYVQFGGRMLGLKANSSSNYNFVTAENGGNSPLVTRTTQLGSWETFRVSSNSDATVSLTATVNSRFVCAENAGASALIANRTAIGDWEKFWPQRIGGPNFALQAFVNNKFVTFNGNGTTQAIANASSAGDAQKFTVWYQ